MKELLKYNEVYNKKKKTTRVGVQVNESHQCTIYSICFKDMFVCLIHINATESQQNNTDCSSTPFTAMGEWQRPLDFSCE